MNKMSAELCEFLPWDTEFFGFRIARINPTRLDSTMMDTILEWCRENSIECLYFLANADDPPTIRLAEDNGFHLVEIRMVIERPLKDWQIGVLAKDIGDIHIRPVRPEDIPACQDIARNSYDNSRFYFDDRFPKEKCQAYYAEWIKKLCEGGADLVLVAEVENQIEGYVTCNYKPGNEDGQVYLIGVREKARRSGIGRALIIGELDWFAQQGAKNSIGVTQGRNIPIQRVIQRLGYITRSCQLYYHKWFI